MNMKTNINIRKTGLVALCALALSPAALFAGNTSKTAEERGIIKSVDSQAHQIVVTDRKTKADRTFQWNDQTKFTEHGKAVTAADLKAGEHARFSYAPASGTPTLHHIALWPPKEQGQVPTNTSSHPKR
jgi:hypothetical protein